MVTSPKNYLIIGFFAIIGAAILHFFSPSEKYLATKASKITNLSKEVAKYRHAQQVIDSSFKQIIHEKPGQDRIRKFKHLIVANDSLNIVHQKWLLAVDSLSYDDNGGKSTMIKHGILGYSYFPKMSVHDTKNIHVFISILLSERQLRDTLQKIVKDDNVDDHSGDIDSIKVKYNIPLYKTVTVELISLDSAIKVTRIHQSDQQDINLLYGNQWSWTILATSADHPVSKLKLNITTKAPNDFITRTIPINISVESHFFRKIYSYLIENPKVLVGSILIPLLSFIGVRIFKSKTKKKDEKENDDDE